MRLLVVCNKPPFPSVDGGTLAMASLLFNLYTQGYDVEILVFSTHKHPYRPQDIPPKLRSRFGWHTVAVNTKIRWWKALGHLLTGKSYILHRFQQRPVADKIEWLLEEYPFELIHLESLFTLPYVPLIKKNSLAPIVYRSHNIEYRIWEQVARETKAGWKQWYLAREASLLRKTELRLIPACDGIMAISPSDRQWIETQFPGIPVIALPFSIPLPASDPPAIDRLPSFFHLGAMDWLPNEEAVRWLLSEIWPKVMALQPKVQLWLAGRSMPGHLLDHRQEGVHICGEVEDAKAFMMSHGVLVVPLRSGSGLRIKIIEAMSMGIAVITTPQGVRGIPAEHDRHLLVAETADTFAKAMLRLIEHPEEIQRLGRAAKALVAEHYTPEVTGRQMDAFYNQMLGS